MSQQTGDWEYFEYPQLWEDQFRRSRSVAAWELQQSVFPYRRGKRRPGTLLYFAQYALTHLLRRDYGIESFSWFHLASIDGRAKRQMKAGKVWQPASPSPSRDPLKTKDRLAKWATMRERMGSTFDRLQKAVVGAALEGYRGEPDLFCYSPQTRLWFFAEAKTEDELVLDSQARWFDLAEGLGDPCPVFRCRVVPERDLKSSSAPRHSPRWVQFVGDRARL